MDSERSIEFRRNPRLENLLRQLNGLFASLERKAIKGLTKPQYPVILIQGVARSGTTPLMQWLAGSGYFSYPSNLLSRFYGAPYIGAKIQQLLFDPRYTFKDELDGIPGKIDFHSVLGKTRGMLAPNEFWYFWRRFFHFGEIQYLTESRQRKVKCSAFLAEIAALESVFEKPFIMKGMIVNWNIPFVSRLFDKVLFIFIRRHPLYNMQSLLQARRRFFGNERAWYSFKPPEYTELKKLPAEEQVAGQVFYTNLAIQRGLEKIKKSTWLEINYEEFCAHPGKLFAGIVEKFALQGYKIDWHYRGPGAFTPTNKIRFSRNKISRIAEAYEQFSGEKVIP